MYREDMEIRAEREVIMVQILECNNFFSEWKVLN